MTPLIYQEERVTDTLLDEIESHIGNHLKEVIHDETVTPEIQRDAYKASDKAGVIRTYTARNGKLRGYAVFIVTKHIHYRSILQATQDVFYLEPEYRQGWSGINFLKWCDKELEKDGVNMVFHNSSDKKDIGPMLKRVGYMPIQRTYVRRLG